jgi:hypothetical protein
MLNTDSTKPMSNQEALEEVLLGQLQDGPLYRFSDSRALGTRFRETAPASTPSGTTLATSSMGIAGRNPAGKGLNGRLRSHASGGRSGDQFCVHDADHYVLPELTREQVEAIRASHLSMDSLVREKIHADFAFRFAAVDTYAAALRVENAIKGGALPAGRPRLNPAAP